MSGPGPESIILAIIIISSSETAMGWQIKFAASDQISISTCIRVC